LGTELIEALEDYANEILSVDCLIYNVDKNNKGSIKIAEKLGFVYHKSFLRKVSEEKVLDMLQYVKSTN
jgi:RimJ/RimL family protein N-acetyltransferase